MKILIVSDGYPENDTSLSGIFAFDQAKALKAFGHDVLFVSIDLRSIRRKRKFGLSWIKKDEISIINYSIPLGRVPVKLLLYFGKKILIRIYPEILNKFGKPDVIHAHFTIYGNIASILKEKYSLPLVITEHSSDINSENITEKTIKLGFDTYPKANIVISVSSILSRRINMNWNIYSTVIPNIVDTKNFIYSENNIDKKKIKDNFLFLSVGRLDNNKGFDLLLSAFKNANFNNNIRLKIVGQGILFKELKKEIYNNGLHNQIDLIGQISRENIAKLMQSSDAFVLASRAETFGVVFIEAMSAGLPVIATTCGGPEDFVDDSNGILVPVNDVVALTDAFIKMYKTANNYNRNNIASSTQQKFSPNAIASKLTDIYIDVINKTKK